MDTLQSALFDINCIKSSLIENNFIKTIYAVMWSIWKAAKFI